MHQIWLSMSCNKLHIENCPLCGGNQFHPFLTCKDHYATGEIFSILQCGTCGFTFTQDAPVEAEIGRYYESPDYISHSDTRQGLMNKIYHQVRAYMLKNKAKLVEQAAGKKGGRILDIGTGTGYFSHTMQERGWQVDAVEKSAQARAFAQKHFNLDVKAPELLSSYGRQQFDVITMWHVMEHIEQVGQEWDTLNVLLKEDGVAIIAVPNCGGADAAHYQAYWAAYDVPRHLWHFTPNTLQLMAAAHGFQLVKRLPMPFDGFYVSMLSEKYKGCSAYFLKGGLVGFGAWLKAVSNADASSSIIYILRKQEQK